MAGKASKTKILWNDQRAGLLSWTSDMDAWSFSLPAGFACPMIVARDEDDICFGCYAQINRYNMPNVLRAQTIRHMWVKENLKENGVEWVAEVFIAAIRKDVGAKGFFRVHDSGDFISPNYILMWQRVCQALPKIKFWFPTRSWDHTTKLSKNWRNALTALAALGNVTVRPSAIKYGDKSPDVAYLSRGTTVVKVDQDRFGAKLCPKTSKGGSCSDNNCRSCWGNRVDVAYLVHGWLGRHVAPNAYSEKIQNTRNRITSLTLERRAV